MTAKKVKGYEVVVKGQYQAASGKDRFLRPFGPEKFFIPEQVKIQNGRRLVEKTVGGVKTKEYVPVFETCDGLKAAQHVIQRQLLPIRLAEKYPDCVRFRRCDIVSSRRVEVSDHEGEIIVGKVPVERMTKAQLQQYCNERNLPVPVASFQTVEDARRAVKDEEEFQKTLANGVNEGDDPAANPAQYSAAEALDDDQTIRTSKVSDDPMEDLL